MDPELVATIAGVVGGQKINVARFCREHGISRDVFYKYVTRFRTEGAAGFTHRSTARHRQSSALPASVVEAVLRTRKELDEEGRDNGPISIGWRLGEQGITPLPSRSSIYRILAAHGQITPHPGKKPRTRRRFEYTDPNGCWQIDGMETYLAGGEKVCVLQILDDHSRLDVGCYAATSENGADTWKAMQQAFAGYGLPVRVLSDNGLAFSGKHRGITVELERRLAAVGVATIASSVYHPQTCGKNERAHQTLHKWLAKKPTPDTLAALQQLLDEYRVMYNNRQHQGIGGVTPQQRYDATHKAAPTGPPLAPATTITQRPVSTTGVIAFSGYSIILGRRWAGHTATVHHQDDHITILIDNTLARELTLDRSVRYQRITTHKLSAKC